MPHTHADDHDHSHTSEAEAISEALKGRGDKGARVTLLGLLTNIGLTIIKGVAGWYLNSAVLLADAGHSLSDLMADFVTLFFYTFSRRQPSAAYPYGYGKFESLGTSTVAIFLLLGAWAIGWHSYAQLEEAIPSLRHYLPFLSAIASSSSDSHSHGNDSDTDPNAAWVALISILAKESMYRLSASVALSENSPVLMANALHHRSDMYSSFVSLVAILGTWWMPSLPLDPIGSLIVTLLIIHQAGELLGGSLHELTDHSVPSSTLEKISSVVSSELALFSSLSTLAVTPSDIRGLRRGAHLFIDVNIDTIDASKITVAEAIKLEDAVVRRVRGEIKQVRELRLRFTPISL